MSAIQAAVLGLIQGITEFLPISSSGHLVAIPIVFGWQDQGLAFDVILHLATLGAVVIYFRKRLLCIIRSMVKADSPEERVNKKLGWYMLISMIPAGLAGIVWEDWIQTYARSASVIMVTLIVWGAVLGWADRYAQTKGRFRTISEIGLKQVIFIACAQALALVPGTSRSGITISAGLFSGLSRTAAAEFSFLISIPVIAGAGFLKTIEFVRNGIDGITVSVLTVGFVIALVSGIAAIAGLMKIVNKWSYLPFVAYRFVLAAVLGFIMWI